METKEKIKVFIDFQNGKTVCICKRSRKRCGKNCSPEVVERDKFAEWERTFHRDRFGKSEWVVSAMTRYRPTRSRDAPIGVHPAPNSEERKEEP